MTHPRITWPAVIGAPTTRITKSKAISRATRAVIGRTPRVQDVSATTRAAVKAVSGRK
jgi:hypothetical protein